MAATAASATVTGRPMGVKSQAATSGKINSYVDIGCPAGETRLRNRRLQPLRSEAHQTSKAGRANDREHDKPLFAVERIEPMPSVTGRVVCAFPEGIEKRAHGISPQVSKTALTNLRHEQGRPAIWANRLGGVAQVLGVVRPGVTGRRFSAKPRCKH